MAKNEASSHTVISFLKVINHDSKYYSIFYYENTDKYPEKCYAMQRTEVEEENANNAIRQVWFLFFSETGNYSNTLCKIFAL